MMTPSPEKDVVRGEVLRLMERSEAARALGPEKRARLTEDMVKVGGFLADKGWLTESPPAARALGDAVDSIKQRLAQKPGQIGSEFKAGAVREGVDQLGEMVKKIDFVGF